MSVERLYSHRERMIEQKIDLALNRKFPNSHDPRRGIEKAKLMGELEPVLPKEPERAALYAERTLSAVKRGMLSDAEAESRSKLAFDIARSQTRSNEAARAALADINQHIKTHEPGLNELLKHYDIGSDPLVVKCEMERYQERKQAADRAAPAAETSAE